MIPIDPRFMTVMTWVANTMAALLPYGVIPILTNEDKWRDWAAFVVLIPEIASFGPARPEEYVNWYEWAAAFNETVRRLQN